MTLTVFIPPEVEEELNRRAAAFGIGVNDYAASLLAEATLVSFAKRDARTEAIERLRDFGKNHGLSLGGLTLSDLRKEARP